jgi:hypothetical protein
MVTGPSRIPVRITYLDFDPFLSGSLHSSSISLSLTLDSTVLLAVLHVIVNSVDVVVDRLIERNLLSDQKPGTSSKMSAPVPTGGQDDNSTSPTRRVSEGDRLDVGRLRGGQREYTVRQKEVLY